MRALFVLCMVWLGMHLHSVKKEFCFLTGQLQLMLKNFMAHGDGN